MQTRLQEWQLWRPAKGCSLAEELGASEVIEKSAQHYLLKMLNGASAAQMGGQDCKEFVGAGRKLPGIPLPQEFPWFWAK